MTISVFKDYKIFDAGSKTSVEEILKKLSIPESDVTLDLSRCIIDYPATSSIIDKILSDLQKKKKPGRLIIQTHLNIIEALLLHWLFIGSTFFGIDDAKKNITLDEFKDVLNKKLKSPKISLYIQIVDRENKLLKEFRYGHH